MILQLVDTLTDKEINVGDTVKTFRGTECKLVSFRQHNPAGSGRVTVQLSSGELVEYFPSVIGAQIREIS